MQIRLIQPAQGPYTGPVLHLEVDFPSLYRGLNFSKVYRSRVGGTLWLFNLAQGGDSLYYAQKLANLFLEGCEHILGQIC